MKQSDRIILLLEKGLFIASTIVIAYIFIQVFILGNIRGPLAKFEYYRLGLVDGLGQKDIKIGRKIPKRAKAAVNNADNITERGKKEEMSKEAQMIEEGTEGHGH